MIQIRQEKIKQYIADKELVSIRELRALCPEVTAMTLHRDLDALQKAGLLVKMRGGVRIVGQTGDPSFDVREQENIHAKEAMAKKALGFIKPGCSVFFDAGTSNLALIQLLPDIDMTIFTTGANFAQALRHLANPTINICCGSLNRHNMALSGQNTLEMLDTINIDLGFIGVSGYSEDSGFTCGKESEMLVKRRVIEKARTPVILMDASKLQRLMPYTIAHLEDVDYVISDADLPTALHNRARQAGTRIL